MLADNYIRLASSLVDLGALEAGTPSTAGTTNGDTGNVKLSDFFIKHRAGSCKAN